MLLTLTGFVLILDPFLCKEKPPQGIVAVQPATDLHSQTREGKESNMVRSELTKV